MIENKSIEIDDKQFWEDVILQDQKRKNLARKVKYPNTPEYQNLLKLLTNVQINQPVENEVVSGIYKGISSNQHVFSVDGFKDNVYVENRISEVKYLKNTQIGDRVDILLVSVNEKNYYLQGSICGIYESRAHEHLKSLDDDLVVLIQIKNLNPAGYDVDILHDGVTLPGFMPNTLAGINKLYDPNSIVGKEVEAMIESYSDQEGTYIVSRRKYLKTLIPQAIEELKTGTVYNGHVTGTTPFGVFVEFNECLTGMVHKANIQDDWRERISDIRPGMEIDFYVKEIIKDKIILTQIIRESLWDNIRIGQVIDGRVKDNKNFGTLVLLDDETMGLIHSSELEKLGKKFLPDQEIRVKVLAIDRTNRKIFLTSI